MEKGLIFSIHRFALHDGPGIRTTVFLKSCPLNCAWCHNPESISGKPEVAYFDERCTLCGSCAAACPEHAHFLDGNVHLFDHSLCNACGNCVELCPSDALQMTGYMISAEEVMTEVIKDLPYYRSSGGGLTLSGGEPMAQPEFAISLLREATGHHIHTCLDTCGLVPTSVIEATLPFVSLYLFDYKLSDSQMHKKYTGAGNALILKNLDYLIKSHASVHLRCPVIPGVNDNEAHIASVLEIKKQYPSLSGITLLPYHNTARSKYHRYGYQGRFSDGSLQDTNRLTKWQTMIDQA